jgi:hypothetical protein
MMLAVEDVERHKVPRVTNDRAVADGLLTVVTVREGSR